MPRRSFSLGRIVERMAELSAPRHRELVRGMISELESIVEPAGQRRFALGAIAALLRLALTGHKRPTVDAPGRFVGVLQPEHRAHPGGPSMSNLTTRQLLRRLVVPFAVSLASLTIFLVANYAVRQVPDLSTRGAPIARIVEMLLLALPFTAAMTLPMAAFVSVSWVFTRLGAEGTLAAAQQERNGVRRLLSPVLAVAIMVASLALVSNTQILPRANARLASVIAGAPRTLSDRTMTIGELRVAARSARADAGPSASARAAGYEVEIQKKFALAAACIVLALAGAAIALRFPRGGMWLVFGASIVMFAAYYASIITGESLADRQVISPFVAMWAANALTLGVVMLLVWQPRRPRPPLGSESLAIGG